MLVKVDIGGVMVAFGEEQSLVQPEPFYPYLDSVQPIRDTIGEESGSASFTLKLKAKDLIHLNLGRPVFILEDNLEQRFEGVISRIAYKEGIEVSVDA